MTIETLRVILLFCAVVNYALITFWFALFTLGHDFIYKLHSRWFKLTIEKFDALNYAGMMIYKIAILLFNVAPCIALYIIQSSNR